MVGWECGVPRSGLRQESGLVAGWEREARLVGICNVVGWDCGVSRRGQAFGRKVGGWLGGKLEVRRVGICNLVGWYCGFPAEVRPSAGR